MQLNFLFFLNSILFGAGLAMDAFSVCVANGLNETCIQRSRKCKIATVFGLFQMLMPILGWCCVKTIADYFVGFQAFIPWIALILLSYIGGKMIYEENCIYYSGSNYDFFTFFMRCGQLPQSIGLIQGNTAESSLISIYIT